MLQLYIDLASSRLACRDIQRIQRIQPIQLYSYTLYTAYSTIHPPSARASGARTCRVKTRTNENVQEGAGPAPSPRDALARVVCGDGGIRRCV